VDCRETQLLISLHLDGELSKDEEAALAGHLAACEACCRELALQERLASALRELSREEAQAPPELCGLVMSRLRAERKAALAWLPAAWRKAVASAAAVLIIAGGAAGVTAGLKMAGGGKMIGFETPVKMDADAGGSTAQVNEAASGAGNPVGPPGEAGASGNNGQGVLAPGNNKGNDISSPVPAGNGADTAKPGNTGGNTSPSGQASIPTDEPRALLSSNMKITSTVLKVAVGDLAEARAKAVALAAGAGAATQVFPEQNGDKKIVIIRLTIPSDRAPNFIADLAGIGTLYDRMDESRDITFQYNETLVQYYDLQSRISSSHNAEEQRQLENLASSYKQQLDTLMATAGKRVIMLWLEGR